MKRFKLIPASFLGFPTKEWIVEETDLGYKINISNSPKKTTDYNYMWIDNQWIGLPKIMVENNPENFEEIVREDHEDYIEELNGKYPTVDRLRNKINEIIEYLNSQQDARKGEND